VIITFSRDLDTTTAPGLNLSISYEIPTTPTNISFVSEIGSYWDNFRFTSPIQIHYGQTYPGQVNLNLNNFDLKNITLVVDEEDLSDFIKTSDISLSGDASNIDGLNTGIIVVIFIAVLAIILALTGLVIFIIRKRHTSEFESMVKTIILFNLYLQSFEMKLTIP
jgi:hypothetical protein